MMFQIEWKETVLKDLEKLEPMISKRIYNKVEDLTKNPFSVDIKKLKGSNGFRLRVGDYRVIFEVNGHTILILKIGHRQNIYDR